MLSKQEQLGLAIHIAAEGHLGQFDKGEKPYILHPLHLMEQLLFDMELATIAVLHDVPEDTAWTVEDLVAKGFSKRVTDALVLLTHNRGEPYGEYINGMLDNYDCIRVKRKDIDHNSRVIRLKGVSEKDLARIEKYHRAYITLGEARARHTKGYNE